MWYSGLSPKIFFKEIKFLLIPFVKQYKFTMCFPGGDSSKEPTCQCRRLKRHRFDSWTGRSSGGGLDNPLQYFCLENPMDRGARQAAVQRVAESWTLK